jgi:nucleoid-associated protein YgaU
MFHQSCSARVATTAFALADAVALVGLRPDWPGLIAGIAHPHRWTAEVGADRAAAAMCAAAIWVAAIWLAVGFLAVLGTRLPGAGGAVARCVSTRLLPGVISRAIAGVLGLGVMLAPVAAGAASIPGPGQPTAATSTALSPAPTWPTDSPTPAGTAPAPLPAPSLPSSANPGVPPPPAQDQPVPVTVSPGDSLWLIAARRLGPSADEAQIQASWPRWYAANRSEIGDDPGVIRPGTVLQAPPG